MLRLDLSKTCLVCRKPLDGPDAVREDDGPAYWCDEGFVCGPRCAVALARRRAAAGRPLAGPFDRPRARRLP